MVALLKFLMKTRRLSYIERCSNTPHIRPYNVAEHSYYVALYAMLLADLENKKIKEHCIANNLKQLSTRFYDIKALTKKALIHDLEEVITGDILYPLKNQSPAKAILNKVISHYVKTELFHELPETTSLMYIKLWHDSKDETKEGQLIAAMDKFEILIYALTEFELGNKAFKEMFNTAYEILRKDFKQIATLQLILNELNLKQ